LKEAKLKKILIITFAIIVLSAIILGGCTKTEPTTVTTTAPSQPITLKVGHDSVPVAPFAVGLDTWAKAVTAKTEGRVKVEVYPTNTLVGQSSVIDALDAGICDGYLLGVFPQVFPKTLVLSLPGMGFPETVEGELAFCAAFENFVNNSPNVSGEWKKYKVIYAPPIAPFQLISKSKEVRAPTELKGVKVGSNIGGSEDFITLIGGVPVRLPPPAIYQNMQTGLIEAGCVPWDAVWSFKLWEVGKYETDLRIGATMPFVMSQASWNKVSARDQKILMECAVEAKKANAELLVQRINEAKQQWKDYGRSTTTLTPAEKDQWNAVFKQMWDKWISDRKAEGITNADAAFNEWKSAVDKAWAGK
jgi:TRAP-type C4-dicarboxylate transport system substrate-binding protein